MPKRKRSRRKSRPRRRKKAKAKTRVDKRQDRVIRKLVRESMPEKKYFDQFESFRISNATATTNRFIQGYCLTDDIPIWDTTTANANNLRTHSREGLEIVARNIDFKGIITPPRVNRVEYDEFTGIERIKSDWPEHFIVRVMILKFSKPEETNTFDPPTLADLLETPKFRQSTWSSLNPPGQSGWSYILGTSPCPQYSRFRKPYDGPGFKVVYNRVITMEGAKQNILDKYQPTSNQALDHPGMGPVDGVDIDFGTSNGSHTGNSTSGSTKHSMNPSMHKSTRSIPFNFQIPCKEKWKFEQRGTLGAKQTSNQYVMYAYACNAEADDEDESPLVTMEMEWRINFVDP